MHRATTHAVSCSGCTPHLSGGGYRRSGHLFARSLTICRQLSVVLLLGVFLTSLTVPRFGFLWHAHEASAKAHAYHELWQLLTSHAAAAYHPAHHAHPHDHHTAGQQVFLSAASTSNFHAHYFNDTLLIYFRFVHTLADAVLVVFLRVYRRILYVSRHLLPVAARAPPSHS